MGTSGTSLFIRIIFRNPEVYLLKIITLAIAFACSTLIIIFSFHEFTFDRFHDQYNSVFRVLERNTSNTFDGNRLSNRIPEAVAQSMRAYSDDSLVVTRVKVLNELTIAGRIQKFENQKIHATDTNIDHILSFAVVDGSLSTFRSHDQSALLSTSAAIQFFGTIYAAGKELRIMSLNDTVVMTVAAVFEDFPGNSHEEFRTIIHFDPARVELLGFDTGDSGLYGRILRGGPDNFSSLMRGQARGPLAYILQPLSDIYFGPRVQGEDARHGDRYSLFILISITSLIVFLALTSFVNLTTLTLPHRSKELAVKKLSGTTQLSLLGSFARESCSIVGISLVAGILLIISLQGYIRETLAIDIVPIFSGRYVFLLAAVILTSLFVAIGPLFLVMKFVAASPIRLLSSEAITFPAFKRTIGFLQLGISMFLIVSSMVVKRQVNYSLVKEPGRNHDQVVYMRYPQELTPDGLRRLRNDWKNTNGNIVDIMATSHLPGNLTSKELDSEFYFMTVDPGFKDFFNLTMVEGNWFKANDGDSIIVVNEKGKRALGNNTKNVIGVFEDISAQFNVAEKPVKINIASYFRYNYLCIRVLEVDIRETVSFLSDYFEKGTTVSYVNKRFEEWLRYQDRLNALSEVLAIISGLLACCAIYGLSVSIVREKLKQLAIHKLCGAGTLQITRLLVREFTSQLFIALIIFTPVTYIFINELLRSFVYSTHLSWTDPILPLAYCCAVIILLCLGQASGLNRKDLSGALKS